MADVNIFCTQRSRQNRQTGQKNYFPPSFPGIKFQAIHRQKGNQCISSRSSHSFESLLQKSEITTTLMKVVKGLCGKGRKRW